jgi:hypothetical protein
MTHYVRDNAKPEASGRFDALAAFRRLNETPPRSPTHLRRSWLSWPEPECNCVTNMAVRKLLYGSIQMKIRLAVLGMLCVLLSLACSPPR